jgi:hypothetical protein
MQKIHAEKQSVVSEHKANESNELLLKQINLSLKAKLDQRHQNEQRKLHPHLTFFIVELKDLESAQIPQDLSQEVQALKLMLK